MLIILFRIRYEKFGNNVQSASMSKIIGFDESNT
jgi:hypothetical protein